MAAIRIFRWEDAPLPWRLLLAHQTADDSARSHLAIVPANRRTQWETPPLEWTDLLRTVVENEDGLSGLAVGDEMVAGNEPPAPEPRPAGPVDFFEP